MSRKCCTVDVVLENRIAEAITKARSDDIVGLNGLPLTRIQVAQPGHKDGETQTFNDSGNAYLYKWSEKKKVWD